MMLAIESLVRLIENLIITKPLRRPASLAANDNDDASDEAHRRAIFGF